MKMKFKRIALFVCLLPTLTAGAAQDQVAAQFRVIITPDLTSGEWQYVQGGKPVRLGVQSDARSPIQAYRGPATIVLQEPAPGSRSFAATLPKSKDLLLLVPGVGADGQPHVRILKDDLKSFPMGSTLFVNAGTIPLTVRVAATESPLPPNDQLLVPPSGEKTSFVQILREGPDGMEPVLSNNWANNPSMRTLLLLSNDVTQPLRVTALRVSEPTPAK